MPRAAESYRGLDVMQVIWGLDVMQVIRGLNVMQVIGGSQCVT